MACAGGAMNKCQSIFYKHDLKSSVGKVMIRFGNRGGVPQRGLPVRGAGKLSEPARLERRH
eukprot:scaffold135881_cov27-Prasinocladus_malaysianus.AAC.1